MGVNLKFPLRAYRKGFFEMNETTIAAVREDIKILVLTNKGERVVNTDIGTNVGVIMGQLFDPVDREELEIQIGAEIRGALETWMPYVTLTDIEVFRREDNLRGFTLRENDILIRMQYSLNNAEGIRDSIQLQINAPG